MKRKFLTVVLALATFSLVLAGCGEEKKPVDETVQTVTEQSSEESTEESTEDVEEKKDPTKTDIVVDENIDITEESKELELTERVKSNVNFDDIRSVQDYLDNMFIDMLHDGTFEYTAIMGDYPDGEYVEFMTFGADLDKQIAHMNINFFISTGDIWIKDGFLYYNDEGTWYKSYMDESDNTDESGSLSDMFDVDSYLSEDGLEDSMGTYRVIEVLDGTQVFNGIECKAVKVMAVSKGHVEEGVSIEGVETDENGNYTVDIGEAIAYFDIRFNDLIGIVSEGESIEDSSALLIKYELDIPDGLDDALDGNYEDYIGKQLSVNKPDESWEDFGEDVVEDIVQPR